MTVVDASAVAAVLFGEANGATITAHLAGGTYDASYLWLATDRDIELVTLDRELARVNAEIRD